MKRSLRAAAIVAAAAYPAAKAPEITEPQSYLTWTSAQARRLGEGWRVNGRVGGALDFRMLHTEHSYNYKLRATWLTSDVIRASARLAQLSDALTDKNTGALVNEAEAAGDAVILVELDPREGSGVIPLDWAAFLGPKGAPVAGPSLVKGQNTPTLRDARALAGVFRKDYNYEAFWVVFPLIANSGAPLFPKGIGEADLVVRIYDKEGRVTWPVPESARK